MLLRKRLGSCQLPSGAFTARRTRPTPPPPPPLLLLLQPVVKDSVPKAPIRKSCSDRKEARRNGAVLINVYDLLPSIASAVAVNGFAFCLIISARNQRTLGPTSDSLFVQSLENPANPQLFLAEPPASLYTPTTSAAVAFSFSKKHQILHWPSFARARHLTAPTLEIKKTCLGQQYNWRPASPASPWFPQRDASAARLSVDLR